MTLRLDKAKYDFRQFIHVLSPSKARHVQPGDLDPPAEPAENVSREDFMRIFMIQHPECLEFAADINEMASHHERFRVLTAEWAKLLAM